MEQQSDSRLSDFEAVVKNNAESFESALREVVPVGARVALLDFPNHWNIGDSAIWLGTRAALERLQAEVFYECDVNTYSRDRLRRKIGAENVILLQGGGNFGDLWTGDVWKDSQSLREEVVADFPHHQIVQLPQSIHFQQLHRMREAKSHFARHRSFKVLTRDEQSFNAATSMGLDAQLCADAAFSLGALPRGGEPRRDVLVIARRDRESRGLTDRIKAEAVDWPEESRANATELRPVDPQTVDALTTNRELTKASRVRALSDDESDRIVATHPFLANWRLLRGVTLIQEGRVIVTDRLHAHILSILMGTPSVAVDNIYGKLRGAYDLWTSSCALSNFDEDLDAALRRARVIAAKGPTTT